MYQLLTPEHVQEGFKVLWPLLRGVMSDQMAVGVQDWVISMREVMIPSATVVILVTIARDIFLVGCSTGLRVSDLLSLQPSNLEQTGSATYLVIASRKTGSLLRILLPAYVLEIFRRYRSRGNRLLPHISNFCLNKRLKLLGEAAGWTEQHILWRNRDGRPRMVFKDPTNKTHFRFCDLMTSHTMRRSAISMLLASGMAEHLVRKISGHAPNSAEFFRYVDISQDQLDTETLKFYALLEEKPTLK